MEDIKFCKDCKWMNKSDNGDTYNKCFCPENMIPGETTTQFLVTGDRTPHLRWSYCDLHRGSSYKENKITPDICGKEGRWFEPKDEPKTEDVK